jgi:uncharacterized protein YcbX
MTGPRLAHIVRHPIKAIGWEELTRTALVPGKTILHDRTWAVAHAAATFEGQPEGWQRKMNFLRGVAGPELMAIRAELSGGRLRLSHPRRPDLDIDPDDVTDRNRLVDWLRPIWPDNRPAPSHVVHVPGQPMTDVPGPWVSILSLEGLAALSRHLGSSLSIHRFRGNLWVKNWIPDAERDLIGRRLRIGDATVEVRQPITRCRATCMNPQTGAEDTETLEALKSLWGHQDFGIYAEVVEGGSVALGDAVVPA